MTNPFNILRGEAVTETNPQLPLEERLKSLIHAAPIFLFMKGTPDAPMCGFSANVIRILDSFHLNYKSFNILTDGDIREGLKVYSKWPTYPQLYVNGELIGGNDIVVEMLQNGELETLLKSAQ